MAEFKNYRFEDLEVWKIGMEIVDNVYAVTKKFPKDEMFSLTDQLKRASTSIVLNIAEGSGQPTKKAFVQYIQRSKSSVLECVACLKISIKQKFVEEKDLQFLFAKLKEEYFKLIGLVKSMKSNT
ncbi:MAG TPA: four helix bundle protein [Candidatus Paceibacterota bacterium]